MAKLPSDNHTIAANTTASRQGRRGNEGRLAPAILEVHLEFASGDLVQAAVALYTPF